MTARRVMHEINTIDTPGHSIFTAVGVIALRCVGAVGTLSRKGASALGDTPRTARTAEDCAPRLAGLGSPAGGRAGGRKPSWTRSATPSTSASCQMRHPAIAPRHIAAGCGGPAGWPGGGPAAGGEGGSYRLAQVCLCEFEQLQSLPRTIVDGSVRDKAAAASPGWAHADTAGFACFIVRLVRGEGRGVSDQYGEEMGARQHGGVRVEQGGREDGAPGNRPRG